MTSARHAFERLRTIVWYDRHHTGDPRSMRPELFARFYLLNFTAPP